MSHNWKRWSVWPSVFPANKKSLVTIAPESRTFLFEDGVEYTVLVSGENDDEPFYHAPSVFTTYTVSAKDGVLQFTHNFPAEQEYYIRLCRGEEKVSDFAVYALESDLYSLRPLKGDLHSHTHRSDGLHDPAELFGYYREMGYDFQCLTDHNRYYPGGEIDEVFAGVKLGITHVQGEEVHTPDSTVHIVHAGGKESVADIYIYDRERYEREMIIYREQVPANIPENQRERYAEAMWSCDRIHEAGGIAIFPHPYWRCGSNKCFNVCDTLSHALLTSGKFDAFELVGGMGIHGINRAVALWQELRIQGYDIKVVGSSDVHSLAAKDFPYHFTVCFAKENENNAIIDAVKNGWSVACEMSGKADEKEFRAYGSMRLVAYTQFLFLHYFPRLQQLCKGEGVSMRQYAMGRVDAATVETQTAQSADFCDRFFGRKPHPTPDTETLAFEKRWRERHLQSPPTKGSRLTSSKGVTRQI